MKTMRIFPVVAVVCLLALSCQKESETPGNVPVTGITLDMSEVELPFEGSISVTLTPTVRPSDATDKRVVWSVKEGGEDVVRVTGDGVVSARTRGEAEVVATTVDGGYEASCVVKVGNGFKKVISMTLEESGLALRKGESETIPVKFKPASPSNPKVFWSSSDESVATVDTNGTVTAVGEGSALVSAKSDDGGKEGFCSVSVLNDDGLVKGVTVEKTSTYCIARINFKENPKLRFNACFHDNGAQLKTHFDEFSATHPTAGVPIIMTNADFFFNYEGHIYSCDLVLTGGEMKRPPAIEDRGYYPVRSALGYSEANGFEIKWVRGNYSGELYYYPAPVKYTSAEDADSDATGRKWWNPDEAVGGGPKIVENGVNTAKKYYNLECSSFNGGMDDGYFTARTAYGFREDGVMVILVQYDLSLSGLADRMIELGCVNAINYDGGGSSGMRGPGNTVLIRQTDASERYMVSAICISESY